MNKKVEFDVDQAHLKQAIHHLYAAFTWEETPEGHEYWSGIVRRLQELRKPDSDDAVGAKHD